jgi:restriction endonuclease S subunit
MRFQCRIEAKEALDERYLRHFLPDALKAIEDRTPFVTVKHLSVKDIRSIKIKLPPLEEQRRIAAILDKADALRQKRRAALHKHDSLTQSIFLEMFGDPIRNTHKLPLYRIDSLCTIVRGSSPRPQGDPRFYGGPIPRLMVADLTRDGWLVTPRIDSLTESGAKLSRPVAAGTVVMAVSGNVGLVSILNVDACIHDGFVGFTELDDKRVEPRYLVTLLHLLKATHEQRKAGAIFQNLTTTDIKAMQLPIPKLELQRHFVKQMEVLDNSTETLRRSQNKISNLFSSIQHRAFRGEL